MNEATKGYLLVVVVKILRVNEMIQFKILKFVLLCSFECLRVYMVARCWDGGDLYMTTSDFSCFFFVLSPYIEKWNFFEKISNTFLLFLNCAFYQNLTFLLVNSHNFFWILEFSIN